MTMNRGSSQPVLEHTLCNCLMRLAKTFRQDKPQSHFATLSADSQEALVCMDVIQ